MNKQKQYTTPQVTVIEVASTAIMAGSITPGEESANASLSSIKETEDVEFD